MSAKITTTARWHDGHHPANLLLAIRLSLTARNARLAAAWRRLMSRKSAWRAEREIEVAVGEAAVGHLLRRQRPAHGGRSSASVQNGVHHAEEIAGLSYRALAWLGVKRHLLYLFWAAPRVCEIGENHQHLGVKWAQHRAAWPWRAP